MAFVKASGRNTGTWRRLRVEVDLVLQSSGFLIDRVARSKVQPSFRSFGSRVDEEDLHLVYCTLGKGTMPCLKFFALSYRDTTDATVAMLTDSARNIRPDRQCGVHFGLEGTSQGPLE